MPILPRGLATGIGSVPHKDADEACSAIFKYFRAAPFWPQLPQRSARENMNVQFAKGLPGFAYDKVTGKAYFDTAARDFSDALELFYARYLAEDLDFFALDEDYAAGLYRFLDLFDKDMEEVAVLKGHVTGPITLGLGMLDARGRPILYDERMADVIVKAVEMRARWQVEKFREMLPEAKTLIFLDEPYLTSFGSAQFNLGHEEIVEKLEAIIAAVDGLTGIHCCGKTDWTLFTETTADVICFDAYDYTESLTLYPRDVSAFLERGGYLAWGIVPSSAPSPERVAREDVGTLFARLERALRVLSDSGIEGQVLLEQAIITPNCGTGGMRQDLAEMVFSLTAAVSAAFRDKYFS